MVKTYEIIGEGKAIKCLRCSRISYNPNDVRQLYCSFCGYHLLQIHPKGYLGARLRSKAEEKSRKTPKPEKNGNQGKGGSHE